MIKMNQPMRVVVIGKSCCSTLIHACMNTCVICSATCETRHNSPKPKVLAFLQELRHFYREKAAQAAEAECAFGLQRVELRGSFSASVGFGLDLKGAGGPLDGI